MTRVNSFSAIIAVLIWMLTIIPGVAEEPEEREGGIVGTGIVGIINSLGSIHVNGQTIEFPPDFPVSSTLGPRLASSLKPGETVVVEAVKQTDKWMANSIRQVSPLLGPAFFHPDKTISIMGSEITVTANTVFQDFEMSDISDNGQWLAIDGIWNKDKLIASYIRKIQPQTSAQVTASYFGANAEKETYIGGVLVDNFTAQHAKMGDVITVVGVPHNRGLSAQTITRGLFKHRLKRKLVEGYLSQPDETGFYTVYGSGSAAYVSQLNTKMPNGRGLHCIIYDADDQIKRIVELPETLEDRDTILSSFRKNGKDLCF
ncbi:DUF5666 domain-containing protein [Lentilitoribacter sp. Alg239-R112]|uniref:DUF5666 domain-containing protein n=1 Tax=Lentilitoribacter sp. Alg239-R112 TaxID=2305987 RepID=UPI0013A6D70A|nr:DUF5666 domain-containing protein [Lentilitoribacter sp. Alg239-R112]